MSKKNAEKLKASPLFAGLADNEIASLLSLFQEKEMGEGMTVFIENMPGESLYLICEGSVRISRMIAEGEERTLVMLGPQEVFGEMAVLDGVPRAATARVAAKAVLLSLRKTDFDLLGEKDPALALKLARNIVRIFSQRLRENMEEYREMLAWSLGMKG